MYAGIKFNRAAFKHGVTEADILRANVFHAMPCRKAYREMIEL